MQELENRVLEGPHGVLPQRAEDTPQRSTRPCTGSQLVTQRMEQPGRLAALPSGVHRVVSSKAVDFR